MTCQDVSLTLDNKGYDWLNANLEMIMKLKEKNVVNHFNCIIVVVGKRFIINFQKVYSLQKLVKKLKEHFIRVLSLYFVVFALLQQSYENVYLPY